MKTIRLVIIALLMLLVLVSCSPSPLSSSSSESSTSKIVPNSSSSEISPSSASIVDSSSATHDEENLLISAHFEQRQASGWLYWELEITDAEELKLLEGLLSADRLSPLKKGEARWTDGGSAIAFELNYTNETTEGACNPQYKVSREGDRSTLRIGEIYYAYPRETGDKLLEFLHSKDITVSG